MNNETHKQLVNDTEFIDHLALRSITWNELPDPIKLILCSNAVEMDCKHVWRLSIKLREVLIKEARHNGIEPQDCVLIALKEILGEHESFVGVLRSGSPPYDDGLFADVIVNHDFGWSDTNLLVKDIVEEHPLAIECNFGMVVGEEQNNDELLIGGYEPPPVYRRHFGLSYAAIFVSSSIA